MKSVDIPDFGTVDFPDEMSEEQISTVIKKQIMPQVEADTAARKKADRASRGEDPEGDSPNYVSNIARGIGERALQLGGGLMRMAGTTAEDVGDWLERRIPLGTIGSPGTPMTEEQIQQNTVPLTDWGNAAANTQLGYQERTSWQDVKEHPFANVLPFAVEQGLRSIPDMAAVMFAPGAYVASRTGEIAQTRAENDGRDRATVDDLMRAAPAAAVSALLERYGTHSIAGLGDHAALTAMNQLPKAALKAGVKEGGTEFGQEVTEYLGENLGTQKGATVGEALERGLAGAIAGAPFGGGVRGQSRCRADSREPAECCGGRRYSGNRYPACRRPDVGRAADGAVAGCGETVRRALPGPARGARGSDPGGAAHARSHRSSRPGGRRHAAQPAP
jgi:hypothetical protein